MKKIFILSILITPIIAHATGPVAYDGDPDNATYADDAAPYATATIENGDSTTVVSAGYVKGAYNDAIAAINLVASDVSDLSDSVDGKQAQLYYPKTQTVAGHTTSVHQIINSEIRTSSDILSLKDNDHLVSAGAVINTVNNKRISAVTTWGNDTPTQLTLSTASN